MSMSGWMVMRSMTRDSDVVDRKLTPGTTRRVAKYARPFLRPIIVFLVLVVVDAFVMVAVPLLLKDLVDNGVTPQNSSVVIRLSLVVAVLAVFDAGLTMLQRWYSSRIGEGLIYDLRTEVFSHVLRQPIAFFTRAQTGSLVSRLNSDVIGAQAAFTSVLSSVVSNAVSLVLIVAAMFTLSWQLTLGALLLVPFFLIPARIMGKRLAGLSTLQMNLNADMGSRMTERFNVAGALLVKLFGNPGREDREYSERAAKVRDAGIKIAMNRTVFMVALGLVAALATAMVYGFGGVMAVNGTLTVGTLLALAALLGRLYAPLTAISNVRVDVMTALVSFERVFEVLDLQPLVTEKADARTLPDGPLGIDVDHVSFRYPSADEVSLASLESTSSGDRGAGDAVLHDVSFSVAPGPARRPRRTVRGRQDDDHRARLAALRPRLGRRAGRRRRPARRDHAVAPRLGRRRDPGRPPLPRHDPREPRLRPTRGDRGADAGRAGGGAGAPARRHACPRASTPWSATAVTASPAARSSASRSPGCSSRVLG